MKALLLPRAPAGKGTRGRDASLPPQHQPTPYGRLLASMPISLQQARMLVAAASRGLLHEGAVLAAVQVSLSAYRCSRQGSSFPFRPTNLWHRQGELA